jgi:hypothetical protein
VPADFCRGWGIFPLEQNVGENFEVPGIARKMPARVRDRFESVSQHWIGIAENARGTIVSNTTPAKHSTSKVLPVLWPPTGISIGMVAVLSATADRVGSGDWPLVCGCNDAGTGTGAMGASTC